MALICVATAAEMIHGTPQVRGLHVVFLSTTWGQCCHRLTATGQAVAGQALLATSNHKDDTH